MLNCKNQGSIRNDKNLEHQLLYTHLLNVLRNLVMLLYVNTINEGEMLIDFISSKTSLKIKICV